MIFLKNTTLFFSYHEIVSLKKWIEAKLDQNRGKTMCCRYSDRICLFKHSLMYSLTFKVPVITYVEVRRLHEQITCQIMNFMANLSTYLLLIYCQQTCQHVWNKILGQASNKSYISSRFRRLKSRIPYVWPTLHCTTSLLVFLRFCSVCRVDLEPSALCGSCSTT